MLALGIMSGTSADGVDIALLETDGQLHIKLILGKYYSYPSDLKKRIIDAYNGISLVDSAFLSRDLTLFHIEKIKEFLFNINMGKQVEVIGFSGQTIFHQPENGVTINIGDANLIAYHLGIKTVSNFRQMDVAAGGNGAPLVPIFHANFFGTKPHPYMILNIGGVSNITYIDSNSNILACDIGPGNAIMDDLLRSVKNDMEYDDNGAIASSGQYCLPLLHSFLKHKFYDKLPPKSLDRNAWDITPLYELLCADALATCVEWIACSVKKVQEFFMFPVQEIIVCGGGVYNGYLMNRIAFHHQGITVKAVDNIDPKMVEAYAFAYLAVRKLLSLPISYPNTTGVIYPIAGGMIC